MIFGGVASNFMTLDRELRILVKASEEVTCNNLFLITMSEEKNMKMHRRLIHFIPVWKWLISDQD